MADIRLPPQSRLEMRFLGYYAASSGKSSPTFRYNHSVPSSNEALEDGTDGLSQNVGKGLPVLAAK
jgi:hypothetical protein